MAENAKIRHFLGKNHVVVPVPMMQWASGTGATQSGTGTHWQCGIVPVPVKVVPVPLLLATLIWHIFAPLSPVFVHDCLETLIKV